MNKIKKYLNLSGQIENMKDFSKEVKLIRTGLALTQKEFGKLINTSESYICYIENGKKPSKRVLRALSRYCTD
jgi:transcriptional regulator with XRE-family HTH domain